MVSPLLVADALAAELPPDARAFIDKNRAVGHRGPNGPAAFDLSTLPFRLDDESKLKQLEAIDTWHRKLLSELFGKLKGVQEGGKSLLDRSMGTTNNLPVLLAGGGFKHGQHLAFDTNRNYPLPNLVVSMVKRMGIET